MTSHPTDRPLIAAGILLGAGLGGFVDGILFHQILQSHSMLSAKIDRNTVAGLEINMFWDGMFHALVWMMTVLGLAMLWTTVKQGSVLFSTRLFAGSLALGWGLFNLVEGILNHHVLHLHHVTETENHLVWDLLFLVSGVVLAGMGCILMTVARSSVGLSSTVRTAGSRSD